MSIQDKVRADEMLMQKLIKSVENCESNVPVLSTELMNKVAIDLFDGKIARDKYYEKHSAIDKFNRIFKDSCSCTDRKAEEYFPEDMNVMSVDKVFETYEKEGYEHVQKDIGKGMIEHRYVKKK